MGMQPFGRETEIGRIDEEFAAQRARFATLAPGLMPDHPDVQRARREMGDIQARLNAAKARAAADTLEQKRMETAVERGRKNVAALESRVAAVDQRFTLVPANGACLSELSRDADAIRA